MFEQMDKELRTLLLQSGETHLDPSMRQLIEKWSAPAKAIEVLEVLDKCIHGSLASGVVVACLQMLYAECCKHENIGHEVVAVGATWRNKL